MQYVVTAAFLLAVVAGSFAAVILGGYGIARLIALAHTARRSGRYVRDPQLLLFLAPLRLFLSRQLTETLARDRVGAV